MLNKIINEGNTWNYFTVCKQILILNRIIYEGNTWNYLSVCKQMIDVK